MKKTNENANNEVKGEESNAFHVEHIDSKGKKVSAKAMKKKEKKPWTKKRVFLKIFLPIILVLLVLLGGVYGVYRWYKSYLFSQIEFIPKEENPTFVNDQGSVVSLSDYTSETQLPLVEEEHIHNFLLIGIDSRSKNYTKDGSGNLADVIMVMSVDDSKGTVKLVTVQRDLYAYFPGYKNPQKINAAMTYGGPVMLSEVVSNHLRLKLDGFAFVNFYHMEQVIDAVGGIDIHVTKNEVFTAEGGLNALLREQNHILGVPDDTYVLSEYGDLHLNGRQAVAYSRIRKVGNGDYGRSQRQINVLNQLLHKYTHMGKKAQISALDDILKMIATDIEPDEIEKYAFDFLPKIADLKLETLSVPIEGCYKEGTFSDFRKGEWSIRADWNAMIPSVQEFLYGETFEVDKVREIPGAPKKS